MGLETVLGRRDKAKLKLWYKLASMSEDRYPRRVFAHVWDVKPRIGRKRKVWRMLVDDLIGALDVDKEKCLEDIGKGDSSLKAFLALMDESSCERESRKFMEGHILLWEGNTILRRTCVE